MTPQIKWVRQIITVLNEKWAPIPGDTPEDEYDSYAQQIASLMKRNASDAQLLTFLEQVECDQMGLGRPFDRERGQLVVAAIRALPIPKSN